MPTSDPSRLQLKRGDSFNLHTENHEMYDGEPAFTRFTRLSEEHVVQTGELIPENYLEIGSNEFTLEDGTSATTGGYTRFANALDLNAMANETFSLLGNVDERIFDLAHQINNLGEVDLVLNEDLYVKGILYTGPSDEQVTGEDGKVLGSSLDPGVAGTGLEYNAGEGQIDHISSAITSNIAPLRTQVITSMSISHGHITHINIGDIPVHGTEDTTGKLLSETDYTEIIENAITLNDFSSTTPSIVYRMNATNIGSISFPTGTILGVETGETALKSLNALQARRTIQLSSDHEVLFRNLRLTRNSLNHIEFIKENEDVQRYNFIRHKNATQMDFNIFSGGTGNISRRWKLTLEPGNEYGIGDSLRLKSYGSVGSDPEFESDVLLYHSKKGKPIDFYRPIDISNHLYGNVKENLVKKGELEDLIDSTGLTLIESLGWNSESTPNKVERRISYDYNEIPGNGKHVLYFEFDSETQSFLTNDFHIDDQKWYMLKIAYKILTPNQYKMALYYDTIQSSITESYQFGYFNEDIATNDGNWHVQKLYFQPTRTSTMVKTDQRSDKWELPNVNNLKFELEYGIVHFELAYVELYELGDVGNDDWDHEDENVDLNYNVINHKSNDSFLNGDLSIFNSGSEIEFSRNPNLPIPWIVGKTHDQNTIHGDGRLGIGVRSVLDENGVTAGDQLIALFSSTSYPTRLGGKSEFRVMEPGHPTRSVFIVDADYGYTYIDGDLQTNNHLYTNLRYVRSGSIKINSPADGFEDGTMNGWDLKTFDGDSASADEISPLGEIFLSEDTEKFITTFYAHRRSQRFEYEQTDPGGTTEDHLHLLIAPPVEAESWVLINSDYYYRIVVWIRIDEDFIGGSCFLRVWQGDATWVYDELDDSLSTGQLQQAVVDKGNWKRLEYFYKPNNVPTGGCRFSVGVSSTGEENPFNLSYNLGYVDFREIRTLGIIPSEHTNWSKEVVIDNLNMINRANIPVVSETGDVVDPTLGCVCMTTGGEFKVYGLSGWETVTTTT